MAEGNLSPAPRRAYELLVKQMLHGLSREERRLLDATGVIASLPPVVVGSCSDPYPRVHLPTSLRDGKQALGLITDQFGDLVVLDTRTARRPLTGVLHAADRAEERLPELMDEEDLDAGDEILKEDERQSDALEVDDEEQPPDSGGATIWGASFALTGPTEVELIISGATACPIAIHGATKSDLPFPGRRMRWREGRRVVRIQEGEESAEVGLALSDLEPAEEARHRLTVVVTWRATRSGDLGGHVLLVHLSIRLAESMLPHDHPADLFSASIQVSSPGGSMRPLPSRSTRNAMFDRSRRMASGHNCAATWECRPSEDRLTLTAWPTWDERRAKHSTPLPPMPSREDLRALVSGYRRHLSRLDWEELTQPRDATFDFLRR